MKHAQYASTPPPYQDTGLLLLLIPLKSAPPRRLHVPSWKNDHKKNLRARQQTTIVRRTPEWYCCTSTSITLLLRVDSGISSMILHHNWTCWKITFVRKKRRDCVVWYGERNEVETDWATLPGTHWGTTLRGNLKTQDSRLIRGGMSEYWRSWNQQLGGVI